MTRHDEAPGPARDERARGLPCVASSMLAPMTMTHQAIATFDADTGEWVIQVVDGTGEVVASATWVPDGRVVWPNDDEFRDQVDHWLHDEGFASRTAWGDHPDSGSWRLPLGRAADWT